MILEIFKATGTITVNDFNATTAAVLAILLVRFFQEGQVIPALKLLVLTMIKATRELVRHVTHHGGHVTSGLALGTRTVS